MRFASLMWRRCKLNQAWGNPWLCGVNMLIAIAQKELASQVFAICRRARKRPLFSISSIENFELFAAPLLLWLPEKETSQKDAAQKLMEKDSYLSQAVQSALRCLFCSFLCFHPPCLQS